MAGYGITNDDVLRNLKSMIQGDNSASKTTPKKKVTLSGKNPSQGIVLYLDSNGRFTSVKPDKPNPGKIYNSPEELIKDIKTKTGKQPKMSETVDENGNKVWSITHPETGKLIKFKENAKGEKYLYSVMEKSNFPGDEEYIERIDSDGDGISDRFIVHGKDENGNPEIVFSAKCSSLDVARHYTQYYKPVSMSEAANPENIVNYKS